MVGAGECCSEKLQCLFSYSRDMDTHASFSHSLECTHAYIVTYTQTICVMSSTFQLRSGMHTGQTKCSFNKIWIEVKSNHLFWNTPLANLVRSLGSCLCVHCHIGHSTSPSQAPVTASLCDAFSPSSFLSMHQSQCIWSEQKWTMTQRKVSCHLSPAGHWHSGLIVCFQDVDLGNIG